MRPCKRLNPFFIRSAVGIYTSLAACDGAGGLNPFFIRSAVGIFRWHPRVVTVCLNPFFIRSAVGMDGRYAVSRTRSSLNPFFIRSAVGIGRAQKALLTILGLNPFFIRSAVGMIDRKEQRVPSMSQSLLHQVCGWNPILLFSASKQRLGTGVVPSRLVCPS